MLRGRGTGRVAGRGVAGGAGSSPPVPQHPRGETGERCQRGRGAGGPSSREPLLSGVGRVAGGESPGWRRGAEPRFEKRHGATWRGPGELGCPLVFSFVAWGSLQSCYRAVLRHGLQPLA